MNGDPYSRFYWKFIDEYPEIYDDDELFAWFMRLLVVADGVFPQPAQLPRRVTDRVVEELSKRELIELLPGDRYRVRGLLKERERRSEAGRAGGLASGRSRGKGTDVERPLNDPRTKPNLDEHSSRRDEEEKDSPSGESRARAYARDGDDEDRLRLLADELTGRPYALVGTMLAKVSTEQLPHGYEKVATAWRQVAANTPTRPTIRQLVFGADNILNAVPKMNAEELRAEQARIAQDRRVAQTKRMIAEMQGIRPTNEIEH